MLTQLECAQIAGMIEGTGYFSYTGQGRYMKFVIGSTSLKQVLWLKKRVGGRLTIRMPGSTEGRPYGMLTIQGEALRAMLTQVEPFMFTKDEQIRVVLAHMATIQRTGRAGTPDSIKEARATLVKRLAELNRRPT